MLKALELVGFKSFADKTRFDFPPGITAVVGPNGSGKSNVVDAIKWVLGEQSVKTLRGKEMADVIFNGSASRPPMNTAETTLTFDNSQRVLPIDAHEVHITRRVYRSGEGEYLINRQPCRLRDIRELFSGTGVATEAYSVIEQGKVDVLLQSSPRDRRMIFEEAAGISRFKAKKVECLRRLERVEQNLLRLSDIVTEVENRLRQVRAQASKARRYAEYSQRLQQLRTHVSLVDWQALGGQLAAIEADVKQLHEQRVATTAAAERAEAAADEREHAINAASDSVRTSEAQAAANRERIATREASIEHERRRGEELESEAARQRRQLAAVNLRVGDLRQVWQHTTAQLAAAEEAHALIAAHTAAGQQQLAEVEGRLQELRGQSDAARQEYLAETRLVAGLESQATTLAAQIDSCATQQEAERNKLTEIDAALELSLAERDALARQVDELGAEAERRTAACVAAERQSAEATTQRARLTAALADLRDRQTAARERAAVLQELERQFEGFGTAVKEVLTQARANPAGPFRQVRGVVAELLQVDSELAPLIEIALGDRAQHCVVGSLDDLLADIARDRHHFAGQVSFTALEAGAAGSETRPENLRGRPGVVGRADELVQTAPQFVPLARRLLGHTWVVESLTVARSLAATCESGWNFVTVGGELLAADGTVSFGPCQRATGLISRRSELRELAGQVDNLAQEIEATSDRLDQVSRALAAAEARRKNAADQRQASQAELAETRVRAHAARERCERLGKDRAAAAAAVAAASAVWQGAVDAVAQVRARWADAQRRLAVLDTRSQTLSTQTDELAAERRRLAAIATAAQVEVAKSEERLVNLRLRAQQAEHDQQERSRTVAELRGQLESCLERLRGCQGTALAAESEAAHLYLHKDALTAQIRELLAEREAQRAARAALVAEAQQRHAAARALDERMHAQELAAGELRHARASLVERLREDYGVDLSTLVPEPGEIDERPRDQIDLEIAELRRKISHIGNVNLDALAELEDLERRYAALSGQYQDLTQAKDALVQIIDRINADSRRLFLETLSAVRENFRALFRKLFGGGQADIVLDDVGDLLDSGIEIVARPPGKEPRNISLLSGGEKTLTCVALLLAIFQYRPSPFCVLDEVDAALDEANIERFIAVLQEFLAWTQFIVVTHSKKTMTCATTLYGVTMQESGVSKRVSVRFEDVTGDGDLAGDPPAEPDSPLGQDETQAA